MSKKEETEGYDGNFEIVMRVLKYTKAWGEEVCVEVEWVTQDTIMTFLHASSF